MQDLQETSQTETVENQTASEKMLIARAALARSVKAAREQKGEKLSGQGRHWDGMHPFSAPDFDFAKAAERLKSVGVTDDDLAWVFGLSGPVAINKWKIDHPSFKKACALGKEIAVRNLVAAGFQRAKGYDDEETKETWRKNSEGVLNLVSKIVTKKHIPADVGALVFMLCNADKRFRSVQRMEISEKRDIHIKIDGNLDAKRIENLARKLLPKDTKDTICKFAVSAETGVKTG